MSQNRREGGERSREGRRGAGAGREKRGEEGRKGRGWEGKDAVSGDQQVNE